MKLPEGARFSGRLRLDKDGVRYLGKGRVQLLSLIDETGSITAAAKAMGMSYKAAWLSVERMIKLADEPLVVRVRGGAGGGETRLTDYGRSVVAMFHAFQEQHERNLAAMSDRVARSRSMESLLEDFSAEVREPNAFRGEVSGIDVQGGLAEVGVALRGAPPLLARLPANDARGMGLARGVAVRAHVPPAAVCVVLAGELPATSAENRWAGTLKACRDGTGMGEIEFALGGGQTLLAAAGNAVVRSLTSATGAAATALFPAAAAALAREP